MGIREFLGFGSASSSSGSRSGGSTSTYTGADSAGCGWHRYDEQAARRHHRDAQVSLPEPSIGTDGQRVAVSDPYNRPDNQPYLIRNFGAEGPWPEPPPGNTGRSR